MDVQKFTRSIVLALAVSGAWCTQLVYAQATGPESTRAVDGIAAVVNTQVITLRQLDKEVNEVVKSLQAQQIPLPDTDVLERQVLQRLIDEQILNQEALKIGLNPAAINAEGAAAMIAERNNFTLEQLQLEIERSGLNWETYLKGLQQEVLIDQIRQRAVDPRISISDSEVDAFLKSQGIDPNSGRSLPIASESVELGQILVRIPAEADRATQAQLRQKAEDLLRQARDGADFAGLAAAYSDGPEALQGGVMGVRPLEGWPDIFIQAVSGTGTGQVADLVKSGAGFHIIKVIDREQSPSSTGSANDILVTQTRAQHILVRLDQITSDEQAQQRIEQLARRIQAGESFDELARAYSDDATAPQGGDLGWLSPGETVAPFEEAMDRLTINEVSEPVRSQFGWHLIRVKERRERNVGDEFRRLQARQILHQQRVEPAFDDWLSQARSQAFIDNRLDPQANSGRR